MAAAAEEVVVDRESEKEKMSFTVEVVVRGSIQRRDEEIIVGEEYNLPEMYWHRVKVRRVGDVSNVFRFRREVGRSTNRSGHGATNAKPFVRIVKATGKRFRKRQVSGCKGQKVVQEKKVLEVHIEKGMMHNQKIVFNGEADEALEPCRETLFLSCNKKNTRFLREKETICSSRRS